MEKLVASLGLRSRAVKLFGSIVFGTLCRSAGR
jgi:hypothetical protein